MKVTASNDEKTLYITVADSGRGMEEKHRDRNSSHGGNGIGLSIVSSVVYRLKGTIRVESSPGEGSAFLIELPLSGSQ